MLKLLVGAPNYTKINDFMWDVISFCCGKTKIPLEKIDWGNIRMQTKNCDVQFCRIGKECNKFMKSNEYDMIYEFNLKSTMKPVLKYIHEVEQLLKCDL